MFLCLILRRKQRVFIGDDERERGKINNYNEHMAFFI